MKVTKDDILIVRTCSIGPATTATLRARLLTVDGVIQTIESDLALPTTDGQMYTLQVTLTDGWLISALLYHGNSSDTSPNGRWGSISLIRLQDTIYRPTAFLCAGSYSYSMPIAWPGGELRNPTATQPYMKLLIGSLPGAGAPASVSVPSRMKFQPIACRTNLVTSAVVGTRLVELIAIHPTTEIFAAVAPLTQPASTNYYYSFGAGAASTGLAPATTMTVSFPAALLLEGTSFFTASSEYLDAGDQFQPLFVLGMAWPTGGPT